MWFYYILVFIVKCFWFLAPAGFANMAPTFFKHTFKFLDKPIDGGRTFLGQPVFGRTKTWRGLVVAPFFGEIAFLLIQLFCRCDGFRQVVFFDFRELPIFLGFLLGAAAILGDLLKSFIKRRFKKESSSRWFPFDNIDYILGSFVVWPFFINLAWYDYLAVLALGLCLHVLFNILGFYLGIKKVIW